MISIIKYFRRVLLLLIYVLGVLALGETHPFSQYPMYNSFPNWSYVFFFTDKNQNLIPCNHIGTTGGELAHKFYSIMENSGYSYGYEQEDPNHLKEVGAIIVDQLDFKAVINNNIPEDSAHLVRICYKFKGDSIKSSKQIIYAFSLE